MLDRLWRAVRGRLGLAEPEAPREAGARVREVPAPVRPRVLMITHNPPVASARGRRLTEIFGWHDPERLAREFIADVREVSGGYLDYEIGERITADWYPVKRDGFRYTSESFIAAWRAQRLHEPNEIDYQAQLAAFDLVGRYNRGEMDEVWFFTFPYAGDYESTMVGRGAFWLNSPPVPHPEAHGRFVMMGFNYERDVGCMLESFGHRVESTMSRVYERLGRGRNMWALFTLYDRAAPGRSQCGNVHWAPNSERDYDWGNPRPVRCYCDDWYSYPDLPGRARIVTAAEWGGGDMRAHHKWWLRHLPRAGGETDGVSNNWWRYVADPNAVP